MRKVFFVALWLVCLGFLASCQKENILNDEFSSSSKAAVAEMTSYLTGGSGDAQGEHLHPTPVEVGELPTAITDYVAANYPDGEIKRSGVLPNGNYILIIQNADGTKVGLLFDAEGNFLQVLPPPANGGGNGPGGGHHPHPTPIDVSELPTAITDYIAANYAGDTIQHAGTVENGNYIVVLQNADGTKTALSFDANGNFIEVLPAPNCGNGGGGHHPHPTLIDVSELPTAVTDYIAANYAGDTIRHAGTVENGNYIVVVQNADGTKTALSFDANGNFIEVLPAPNGNGGGHGGGHHPHPTLIDVSDLPAAVTDYVAANYAGTTIERAGTLNNGNYIVVLQNADGTKVRLLFDANGNFVEVLPAPSHHGG